MTKQDWLISIENCAKTLCEAGRTEEVAFIFHEKGHGARTAEEIHPCDYDAVFDDLFQREADLYD